MRAQPVRWKIARRHLTTRRSHRLRWVLASIFVVSILLFGAAGGAAAFYLTSHLPSVNKFHIRFSFQDARIYDSQGHLLYSLADLSKNGGRRVVAPLQGRYDTGNACRGGVNRIPVTLQNATIATEDATFYKNPGFDPLSIVRAAYQDATYGRIVSGASTITQQVVRSAVLNDKRTFQRKAEEIALAYEVSKRYSKRKILWYYLNNVNYGNLAYGATAASRVYFHEPVCKLDLAQAAFLAGLPEAPSAYDPVIHHTVALERLNTVLSLMHKHGYIHKHQARMAKREARHWRFSPTPNTMRFPAFVRYVINQLQTVPQLRRDLYKGIDVYTTLDPRLQNTAQSLVTAQVRSLQAINHVTDGALVSLDLRPGHYGWIRAMVGSADQNARGGQINMATSPRQPGSSMKPFNYVWAFTHGGVGPGTTVVDAPIALPDPGDQLDNGWYAPTDYDHQWHGTVTLRQALDNSLNVPAVKVEYYITQVQNVAQTAHAFGMRSLFKDNPGLGCSVCYALTLGGIPRGTRLLEETAAYGVFATGGVTVPPIAIWKIVQRSTHRVLYCSSDCGKRRVARLPNQIAPKRVIDPAHAFEITSILSDNASRCTPQVCEFGLTSPLLLDRPAAAKTGTTSNWTDNWTVGYTPQIVTGVWTGNADRTPMVNVIGITGAAPIWHDFMETAFKTLRLPVVPFAVPATIYSTTQCREPASTALGTMSPDIAVRGDPLPLCALPDRGTIPQPCPTPGYYGQITCAASPFGTDYGAPLTGYTQSGTTYPSPYSTPYVSPYATPVPYPQINPTPVP